MHDACLAPSPFFVATFDFIFSLGSLFFRNYENRARNPIFSLKISITTDAVLSLAMIFLFFLFSKRRADFVIPTAEKSLGRASALVIEMLIVSDR
jgi:hypothetical protein